MSHPDYQPLHEWWPGTDKLSISLSPFVELEVKVPLDFIARGGQNTLAFVQHIAQHLVNEPGSLRLAADVEADLDLEAAPEAAEYLFLPKGTFTQTRGPEGESRSEPAPVSADVASSEINNSTRSLTQQSEFRKLVMMRDGGDLFANVSGLHCEAVHLVPASRPDIYKDLLDVSYRYDVSFGLAMSKLHQGPYDDYKWSIHCQYHGRSFSKADVRFLDPPKPELCAWHYRQAVLKYIRARRIGFEIEAP
ncbi:hypothetical protein Rhopal_000511-T1 [Rhodotorula paludigena]|uniref:HNH nuclease domain-containing protein n=1 Tax=Rhodotorula paludigena TaxID=86838 RepID=A0AAV5GE02_9BASI|nr:hypothetical protein Rhopal_000511-T1 [Rhodotorula paludigena]